MRYALRGARVFDGEQFLDHHSVIVDGRTIIEVIPDSDVPQDIHIQELSGGILAPGFIDIQVNGGGGVMLNNTPHREAVNTMVAAHRATGTTGMLPTIISDTLETQQACVSAVKSAQAGGNSGVLGVHIEGPFFDLGKRGTHKASMIRAASIADIEWLCTLAAGCAIVTLAPEHTQAGQIRQLSEAGIYVCAGHTNATYQQIQAAIAEGLRGFTHLYNAMSPLASREPGVVGAALECDSTWVGLIADGHHVHPASLRIACRAKPPGKALLVTDAMATVGSKQTFFEIYGERIEEKHGRLVNAEGALAGSAIGMIDAVRIATETVGIQLEESLRMASLYPATFLNKEGELGRIAKDYRADLVHFDQYFAVHNTWVAGQHQAHGDAVAHSHRDLS